MDANDVMMACPDCHTMKMGAMQYKSKMSKCDAFGGSMREMKMM